MKQPKEFGMIKELSKQVREMNKRLVRVERAVPIEMLTKDDIMAIKKSEEEIKKGKSVTAEQLKKELGIE